MSAPIFKGDLNDKPIKFLREMRRYVTPEETALEDIKYVLARSLKGTANSWWDMIESSITS